MKEDLVKKIQKIVDKKDLIDENMVRSFMILVRKILEDMSQPDQNSYLTLRLFCNWVAHNAITQSNTGLRILARVNDALVDSKELKTNDEVRIKLSDAVGFSVLRKELKLFFRNEGIKDKLFVDNTIWAIFLDNLIEIIGDVPLSFPSLSKLDKTQKKIYNQIAKNPIKMGAGVVAVTISLIKYSPPTDEVMCLVITTANTTRTIVPLLIDARL